MRLTRQKRRVFLISQFPFANIKILLTTNINYEPLITNRTDFSRQISIYRPLTFTINSSIHISPVTNGCRVERKLRVFFVSRCGQFSRNFSQFYFFIMFWMDNRCILHLIICLNQLPSVTWDYTIESSIALRLSK